MILAFRSLPITAAIFLIVLGTACSDSETRRLEPLFVMDGEISGAEDGEWILDFGSVAVGGAADAKVVIRNEGTADLWVWVEDELASPFSSSLTRDAISIPPSAELDPVLRFAPKGAGNFEKVLVITTNEAKDASHRIHLSGMGV